MDEDNRKQIQANELFPPHVADAEGASHFSRQSASLIQVQNYELHLLK